MTVVTVTTEHGEMYGQAGTEFLCGDDDTFNLPYGLLISDAGLFDESQKGKGFGKELYRKALSEYGTLYSIYPISDDALHVHESLIRAGIARREYPDNEYGIIALTLSL